MKHLIQLTEYKTGLHARIGLPTEHLAPNHIEELKKPMYSTCLGLILKGYNDYEKQYKDFPEQYKPVQVPSKLKKDIPLDQVKINTEPLNKPNGEDRKNKLNFWDKVQRSIIDIFKEEEDKMI